MPTLAQPLHESAYGRELDALTKQLIRAAGVKYIGQPEPLKAMDAGTLTRFQLIAQIAVALIDTGTLTKARLETIDEVSSDIVSMETPERFARAVIDRYQDKLGRAGGVR